MTTGFCDCPLWEPLRPISPPSTSSCSASACKCSEKVHTISNTGCQSTPSYYRTMFNRYAIWGDFMLNHSWVLCRAPINTMASGRVIPNSEALVTFRLQVLTHSKTSWMLSPHFPSVILLRTRVLSKAPPGWYTTRSLKTTCSTVKRRDATKSLLMCSGMD